MQAKYYCLMLLLLQLSGCQTLKTKGLYEGKYDWTPAQKDAIRKAKLNNLRHGLSPAKGLIAGIKASRNGLHG